jgi:hypothetical protein
VGSADVRALPDRPHIHRQFFERQGGASDEGISLRCIDERLRKCKKDPSCYALVGVLAQCWGQASFAKPL